MAELCPRIRLDAEERAQLDELIMPAEGGIIARLVDARRKGNVDREEIRDAAFLYRAALFNSSHPDARAWGEALHFIGAWVNGSTGGWYARDDFMRQFGLDPSTMVTRPARTEHRLCIDLDAEDQAQLATMAIPGEDDRSRTLARLLGHALDGVNKRQRSTHQARAISASLADHAHPDAATWTEALDWFVEAINEGQPGGAVHDRFVRRFGVAPSHRRR
jgi:hypothetical protein